MSTETVCVIDTLNQDPASVHSVDKRQQQSLVTVVVQQCSWGRRTMTGSGPTFGAFLLLISNCNVWAADECDSGERRPSVKPHNATHLEVSWEGVFQNCSDDHAVAIEVTTEGRVANAETFHTNFSNHRFVLQKDPCRQFEIIVKVFRVDQITSKALANNYNHPDIVPYEPFGGFLKQELSKFCPTKNQPLKTPSALKNCVTNQSLIEQNPPFVSVTMLHPKHISVLDQQIQLNITLEDFPKSFPIKHIIGAIVVANLAALVLVSSQLTTVVFLRFMDKYLFSINAYCY